jgi:NTP pyrophosphatase (non-canonical NTP hydrolase)
MPCVAVTGDSMDIEYLQRKLQDFATARDWDQYHTPKNLSMALIAEAAELVEIFQWLTPDESTAVKDSESQKQSVEDELADILNYTLRLADVLDIDLENAFLRKIERNAAKYPAAGTMTPRSKRGV